MPTPLESAALLMLQEPETGRLQFFRLLADTPLLMLLDTEAEGETLSPRVFELQEGPVVLAFEREEDLAALGQGPLPYAELPGRVLAQLLAGEGLGLGLNLGSGLHSEQLFPPSAMVWLTDLLAGSLTAQRGGFDNLTAPDAQAAAVFDAVMASAPASWAGQAAEARLYARGKGLFLILSGAHEAGQAALAQSVGEALRFAELAGRVVDIAFAEADTWPEGGKRFDWPAPRTAAAPLPRRAGPGTDPERPPILK